MAPTQDATQGVYFVLYDREAITVEEDDLKLCIAVF